MNPKKLHPTHWFTLFCVMHLVVWTIVSAITRPNPPFDSVEGIAWGNQWQLGYDKHPPLAPWLTALAANHFPSIDWSIYLLGTLSVVICFWATWQFGKKVLPPYYALIGTLLLEGIYYYNIAAIQFNPNVLMLPLWAMCNLSFYNAVTTQKLHHWLLVGVLAGLSMLAKYESALLLLVMSLVLCATVEGRHSFQRGGLYISGLVALLIFSPNLVWLIQHDFSPFTYTMTRLHTNKLTDFQPILRHIYYPLLYLVEQAGALLPLLILWLPLRHRANQPTTTQTALTPFNQTYLWIMGLGPFIITGILSVSLGLWVHSLWAFPFFSLIGFLLLAWKKPVLNASQLKHFGMVFVVFFFATVTLRSLFLVYGPYVQHKTNAAHFPGKQIATVVTKTWHERFNTPLPFIAGYRSLVEHITVYSPDKPTPYFAWSQIQSPWVDEQKLQQQGGIFVWVEKHSTSTLPTEIASRFPRAVVLPVQLFHHQTAATVEPIRVGIALLPPKERSL